MKKLLALTVVVALTFTTLVSCSSAQSPTGSENRPLRIVATTFPQYDWMRQVIGDSPREIDLVLLIDNGVDLHSYQPTADDIATIATSDLFIYGGGTSDTWVDDALKATMSDHIVAISLIDVVGNSVKEEAIKEGMQHDHDDEGIHEEEPGHNESGHEEESDHEHAEELDEHVWLSLKNAETICSSFADELAKLDPEHASAYRANAAAYSEKLQALDDGYQKAVESAPSKTLLFGDRFPFRYLVDDYGIDYYAAFPGCSAETEASFETVIFLANKVDELKLRNVMTIEGSDHSIADTIVKSTKSKDQKVLVLDSMQSVSASDIASGTTYLSIMEKNLEVLKAALG